MKYHIRKRDLDTSPAKQFSLRHFHIRKPLPEIQMINQTYFDTHFIIRCLIFVNLNAMKYQTQYMEHPVDLACEKGHTEL